MDSKRSNAINIGLTVLPPPRTIKTAILNFDEYALNKEGIEVRSSQYVQVCMFSVSFYSILLIIQAISFMEERKSDVSVLLKPVRSMQCTQKQVVST